MNQHDFLETTLPTSAKHPGVRSLLTQGGWRRGVADVALAVGLSLSVSAAVSGTVAGQGDARFEPRRPAPVAGRVGMDVPANVTPPPVSTAVQVPAPAHLPAAPHDLVTQPGTSPAASDGKGLGRVGHAASTSVTAGGTSAGTAKQPGTKREARQVVSRETASLAKAKSPRSGVARHERDAKARQALAQGRATKARAATDRHLNTRATTEVHARKGAGRVAPTRAHAAVAPSARIAHHAADPAKRSKAKQPTAARTAKAAQVAKAAKAKKHGASLRSAKAASSGAVLSTRRHGA